MGVIISGIIPLYLNTITAGRSSAYYSTAYKLADSKIEQYRGTSFDLLGSESSALPELPNGTLTTTTTNEIDGGIETDIKKVDITIRWNYKRAQEIKISTYIYRGGL